MKTITQEDEFGCGIACFAFVNKINYKTAKEKYFKSKNAKSIGYLCRDLVKAFDKIGKTYSYRYVKGRSNFKENTIVFIKRTKRYPAGHYLVRIEKGWMDPWINFNIKRPVIAKARSGIRKKLPERAIYSVYPI